MKPKLLVVEDNELTSTLLLTIFDSLGMEVKEISNGLDALPYLQQNLVDVIILDLELPGMTGDQIYSALKKNIKLKSIPVIPFTALADTKSEDSLASNLVWAEYKQSGKIPNIVFKYDDGGEGRNITKDIIDEVARCLINSGKPLPREMAEYFLQTQGLSQDALLKKLS